MLQAAVFDFSFPGLNRRKTRLNIATDNRQIVNKLTIN
jgi:hypothetical protein